MNPTRDTSHDTEEHPIGTGGVSLKRLFFDYSSVVAIIIAAMTWATLQADVQHHERQLERLESSEQARQRGDVSIAERMATKDDVRDLSNKIDALAKELRERR